MSLSEPFGVGTLNLCGTLQKVEDRVVPNDLLADGQSLHEKAKVHPTVPQFLARYTRKELAFSRAPDCFRRRIEASFHDRDTVMACEASNEGVPHFFLSQPFRRFLRASGLSVVRDYGGSTWPVINTQTAPFELPQAVSRPPPFLWSAFWEGMPYTSRIATHLVASLEDLVFYVDAFESKLIGSLREPETIRGHFGPALEEDLGWGDGLPWDIRGRPVLAASLPPDRDKEGWRIFLTREGYQDLRDHGKAHVRAARPGEDTPRERLDVDWPPGGTSKEAQG